MDETFVRIAGRWMYLFRAVDGGGQTVDFYLSETRDREGAKLFLKKALANPDNPPHVSRETACAAIPRPFGSCRGKDNSMAVAGSARDATAITRSNLTTATSSADCEPWLTV